METSNYIGKWATDCVTGITGRLTGLSVNLDGSTLAMLEWVDRGGHYERNWFEVDRLMVREPKPVSHTTVAPMPDPGGDRL